MEKFTNKMKFTTTLACVQTLVRTKDKIKEDIISLEETQDKYVINWQREDYPKQELCSTIYKNTAYRLFREIVSTEVDIYIRENQENSLF